MIKMSTRNAGRAFESVQDAKAKKDKSAAKVERDRKRAQIKQEAGNLGSLKRASIDSYYDNESLEHVEQSNRDILRSVVKLETKPSLSDRTIRAELPTPPVPAVEYKSELEIEDIACLHAEIKRQKDLVIDLEDKLETERTERIRLQEKEQSAKRDLTQAYIGGSTDEIRNLKDRLQALGTLVDEGTTNVERLQKQIDEGMRREDDLRRRLREMQSASNESVHAATRAQDHVTGASSSVRRNTSSALKTSRRIRGPYISLPARQKRKFIIPI